MDSTITWQQGADQHQSENAKNLAIISQWWNNLQGKEISFAQRMLPESGDINQIHWETQRFDEEFVIENPQLRGITLYWQKPGLAQQRSITPDTLDLILANQELYIYPQSQSQVVIRVARSEVIYQKIELQNPLIVGNAIGENLVLLMRDKQQQLDIKITLTPQSLAQLRASLPNQEPQ